ncbi:MAG: diguanylate cyclase [Desulfobacula sp. GWF2_41_7]|nr:MAG: diguanylate cyclase [Desulfobacula sp. GWF2_41_7]
MKYYVKKTKTGYIIDAGWDVPPWNEIPALSLDGYMGSRPDHFPRTEVKLIFDDEFLFVMFRVNDRYVRATAEDHQDNVFEDSCVEFFFTPRTDVSKGYFNLEMNCGGTMLFHFQTERGKNRVVIPREECEKITCVHSLPRLVDPKIQEPVIWTVAYRLPIALLKEYTKMIPPAAGVQWRANFYKCGDKTSHPHWLTWSPVIAPKPDFHRPEFFGILEFE